MAVDLEYRQKCRLWNINTTHLLHALFTRFLLLKQLALPADVTAITFRRDILSQDKKVSSVIIFPDVLVGNGADVVRGLQDKLGKHFPIIGGASGDDQLFEKTYQYINGEVHSESVVGFGISGDYEFGVGVRHGWIPIGLPMKVTKSEGSVVHEIDGKPAINIYREYFGEENAKEIEGDSAVFSNKSVLTYPFGVTGPDHELLIRFATAIDEHGSITCAAEIPQDSEIRMMIGNKDRAIDASRIAAKTSLQSFGEQPAEAAIIFNCIARNNLFGEDAGQEINAIREVLGQDVPIIGFYTYGEQAPIEGVSADIKKCETSFHNETVVIYTLR